MADNKDNKDNPNSEEYEKLLKQGSSIWEEILKESITKKEGEEANIFVFGDKNTGKKSIIRTMNKESAPQDYESKLALSSEEIKPLHGLMNYTHLTLKKVLDDETEINKVGVWMMNELIDKGTFLSLVKPNNILKSVCLIVVDNSRPWNIINSLRKWSDFIYEIFGKLMLAFPYVVQTETRKKSKKTFLIYKFFI